MTLASSPNFVVYDGDGGTTAFGYAFTINTSDGSDIQVYVIDADGNVTLLASNYSVNTTTAKVNYPTVGGVSPLGVGVNALPVGWQIVLMRVEPLSQTVVLTDQGVISLASIAGGMDKLTMICQQLQEQINRCVKYPVGSVASSTDVNAFIAAVNAIIAPPPLQGTYAYCKAIAALNPTTPRNCIVTDQGSSGTNQLFWYSGSVSVGDGGFFGPLAGG